MVALDRADVVRFRTAIHQGLGLAFDDRKLDQLADVLDHRLQALDYQGAAPYLRWLAASTPDAAEWRGLAGALTVGETYFFRSRDHFRALTEHVLPTLQQERQASQRLHILSAGCASGEEAYSLAIRKLVD